jgi:glycosyltransferase involved in cell wall biosynthesis
LEVAARATIPELQRIEGLRLTAFVNREAAGSFPSVDEVVVPVNATNRVAWVMGEQAHLPRLAERAGCDIVHSLGSTAVLRGRFKRVTTIHDLNYKIVPEAHFGIRGLGMRLLVPAAARRSHRILVDAESTASDLRNHLGTDPGKVDVVPLGVAPPSSAHTPEGDLRRSLDLGDRPVLLSVSAKRPHKNLARLLRAHALIDPQTRPMLVIPGYETPHEGELRALSTELGTAADLRMPHWVSTEDLEGLYRLSVGMVFPSLYEGFGLPVLEAMIRGVPVACSDRSSLPEVAGDAALLFDPLDPEAISSTLRQLLENRQLRDELTVAGQRRASEFTWERTARLTADVYRRALA